MDFSLIGLWSQMGMVAKGVVIILLIMSMYSIGITVERFLTFRRGRVQSIAYIGALQPLVASTGRLREAVGLDQRFRGSPVAKVIGHSRLLVARETIGHCLLRVTTEIMRAHSLSQRRGQRRHFAAPRPLRSG